jgi:hypothetical protein
MKRLLLTACVLSPILLTASGKGTAKESPRKCILPNGTSAEIMVILADQVDTEKAPNSPLQANTLGMFEEEYSFLDAGVNTEILDLDSLGIEPSLEPEHSVRPKNPKHAKKRPLSPADRSQNWRNEPRRTATEPLYFGSRPFVPGQQVSPADLAQDWRRTPRLAVIGRAVQYHKKNSR